MGALDPAAQRRRLLDGEHRRVLDRGRFDAERLEAEEQGRAVDRHHAITAARVVRLTSMAREDAGEVDIAAAIH